MRLRLAEYFKSRCPSDNTKSRKYEVTDALMDTVSHRHLRKFQWGLSARQSTAVTGFRRTLLMSLVHSYPLDKYRPNILHISYIYRTNIVQTSLTSVCHASVVYRWVNATYGLAISYVIGDIAYHGYLYVYCSLLQQKIFCDASVYFGPGGGSEFEADPLLSSRLGCPLQTHCSFSSMTARKMLARVTCVGLCWVTRSTHTRDYDSRYKPVYCKGTHTVR
jgi:hypothetical protein